MSLTGRVVPSEKILMQDHVVSAVILFSFRSIYLDMCKFEDLPE